LLKKRVGERMPWPLLVKRNLRRAKGKEEKSWGQKKPLPPDPVNLALDEQHRIETRGRSNQEQQGSVVVLASGKGFSEVI
jgi:hypothetical protein